MSHSLSAIFFLLFTQDDDQVWDCLIPRLPLSFDKKVESELPYVRINLAEYQSQEALKKNSYSINAAAQSVFPDIMLIAGINPTESSQMAILIYPHKEAEALRPS